MKFIDLTDLNKAKCGNHSVITEGNTRKLMYYGTVICVMDLVRKVFRFEAIGYSKSTTKAQTQYKNHLIRKGYTFQG